MKVRDSRKKNWFWIENELIDRDDISIFEKMIYIALARHADKNDICFPSLSLIAKKAKCSRRQVILIMKKLCASGLIRKKNRSHKKRKDFRSNTYHIMSAQVEQVEKVVNPVHHPSAEDSRGVVHHMPSNNTNNEVDTTTTVVVDFEKFREYKDKIRIRIPETEIRQIAKACGTDIGTVYYAADVMDFQLARGTKIQKNNKGYLSSIVRAIRGGTLSIPDGYLPPWERAEKARQEAERQEKEKADYEKTKTEIERERLSPEELQNLKAKNAPALIAQAVER